MTTTTNQVREDRFESHEPPVGSVLRWRHEGVTHVAVHVGRRAAGGVDPNHNWRTTAGSSDRDLAWQHIRALIGNNPCSLATGWVDVPQLGAVDFGDVEVVDFVESLKFNRSRS
jgi:hypothetical protein